MPRKSLQKLSDEEAEPIAQEESPVEFSGITVAQERDLLGLYTQGHPLRDILRKAQSDPVIQALAAKDLPATVTDQPVKMIGVVKFMRLLETRRKQMMAFVTMEDPTGEYSLTVFPASLVMFADILIEGNLLILQGKVSHQPEMRRKDDDEEEESTTSGIRYELILDRAKLWGEEN